MVQIVYSNCACVFMVNDITLLHVMMCLVKFLLIWHILMEVVVAIMTIGKIIYMYAVTTHMQHLLMHNYDPGLIQVANLAVFRLIPLILEAQSGGRSCCGD